MNDVALVVIDMQNDFCDPASRLFVAGAPGIHGNVAKVMTLFRQARAPVVVVLRQHRIEGLDVDHTRIGIFREDPFLVTSPGADLIDGLEIAPTDVVVVKRRWSAFFATDLDMVLRRMGIRTVVLAGVQTPNCIRATANDATSLDYVRQVFDGFPHRRPDAAVAFARCAAEGQRRPADWQILVRSLQRHLLQRDQIGAQLE
jgi:nicotinamidase-related amidase